MKNKYKDFLPLLFFVIIVFSLSWTTVLLLQKQKLSLNATGASNVPQVQGITSPPPQGVKAFANTSASLTLGLHGLGKAGDNANPGGNGNTAPKHPTRAITVTVFNLQNTQVQQSQGNIAFDATSGLFQGTVDLGTLATGDYQLTLKTPGYLQKRLPIIVHINTGQVNTVAAFALVNTDIDNNNQLDILDYNDIINCFGSKQTSASCVTPPTAQAIGSDVDDNGTVGGSDYNLFLREVSVQQGDGGIGTGPTPTPGPTGVTTAWDSTKAAYLARRALLDPTAADVSQLSGVATAADAVNALFNTPAAADVTAYQAGVQSVVSSKATFKTEALYNNTLYTYQLIHNPDKVKQKLYYLWDNIFSVDAPLLTKGIAYDDVTAFHQMLYDGTYGNYITLVGKMQTAYAMAQYLDLTNSPQTNPNENFSRELMQLFLLGPFTPLDKNLTTPNYTELDVNSLAYIFTGYTANTTSHTVTYSANAHYAQPKLFFGQQYNDPVNAVNFIAQTKKTEVSLFLADKLLHFYVSDNASDQDTSAVAQMIVANNFEILPTVKQLLSSDIMYRSQYMQEERYRSPLELVSSYYTNLFGRNNYNVIPSSGILADLEFTPDNPGSIFGRDGFNTNALFYSGTIMNRWIADNNALLSNISAQNLTAVLTTLAPNYQSITTPDALIVALQNSIYLGRDLPTAVKTALKTYLTTDANGAALTFSMTNATYVSTKIPGLLNLMFSQPEFMQQTGNMQATALPPASAAGSGVNNLIVVRARGGYDGSEIVANLSDPAYASNRGSFGLSAANSTAIGGGYVLNNAANALMPLVTSKEAFFVLAAGFANHSRAHDIAGKQMETGQAQNGILAQLQSLVPAVKVVSLTSNPPIMLQGSSGLQIGGSATFALYPQPATPIPDLTARKSALVQILNARQLPQILSVDYAQALQLDSLGGGNGAAKITTGSNNASQFTAIDQLITQNVANVFYMTADGGYDHHSNEQPQLNGELTNVFTNIVNFYNKEKAKNVKLSIVVFSEFGRTNKTQGGNGTDHGTGNHMFVVSNVVHWPTAVGKVAPSLDKNNWMTPVVDARDVWSTLFRDMYSLPVSKMFGRSTDLSTYPVAVP